MLDHAAEADELAKRTNKPLDIGIRIASEEEPKFAFYTSRLGIGYKDIVPFYEQRLKDDEQFRLKMLQFFINTGINDTAHYWSELLKCVHVYCALKRCVATWFAEYRRRVPRQELLLIQLRSCVHGRGNHPTDQSVCSEKGVAVPHIFTEFALYGGKVAPHYFASSIKSRTTGRTGT